jgi:carbonic anhydrase
VLSSFLSPIYCIPTFRDFLVVVCGHTECGAAAASLGASGSYVPGQPPVTVGDDADSPLNRWLAPLTRLAAGLQLSSVPAKDGLPILVRENIKVQVDNVCSSDPIKKAWANGKSPMGKEVWVHGWVYDLSTGKLQDLGISRGPNSK